MRGPDSNVPYGDRPAENPDVEGKVALKPLGGHHGGLSAAEPHDAEPHDGLAAGDTCGCHCQCVMVGSPVVCLVPVHLHWDQPVAGEQMAMDPYLAPTDLGQGLLVAV